MGSQPANASVCLRVSIEANPPGTGCLVRYVQVKDQMQQVMYFNLTPNTVQYWKVGVIYDGDLTHINWSEQRTFTTGPEGGVRPATPVNVSPLNNSTITSNTLTLTWQPVPGALGYQVFLNSYDGYQSTAYENIPTNQLVIPDVGALAQMLSSNNILWHVTARNGYAWGPFSPQWKFTYAGPGANPGSSQTMNYRAGEAGLTLPVLEPAEK